MKAAKATIIALAALVATALAIAAAQTTHAQTQPYEKTETWQKWLQAYGILNELSKTGMNITQYTQKLRQALQALHEGDYQQTENILNQILPELQQLQANAGNYILKTSAIKYLTAAAILSIPPITYYALPRAYLHIWYKTRRKWITKTSRT